MLFNRVRSVAVVMALAGACLLLPGLASAHRAKPVSANAQGHPWRNGVVPRRGAHVGSTAASTSELSFGGGIDGVGVTVQPPHVYLVFWGSQWGTQSTNTAGEYTYSGDTKQMAPDLQAFFAGLGTASETWSGVMTQYCQGVATGAQTCPSSSTAHVGYPAGGALAGVWEDTSSAAPSHATAHAIGAEAVNAANHFATTIGVASAFSSENQYFIVSPTGTHPDGFDTASGDFCAWHDYTGDTTMDGGGADASPNGPLAFTNMPYVTDAGASCGANFVNSGSAGTLDGVTIVGGHEYAETITDEFPAGGWLDSAGNEAGDKCAWISPGSGQGAAQDITLNTGSFAVQSIWANDFNGGRGGCEVSHPIVSNTPGVTVNNPGNKSSTAGRAASVQMTATEPTGGSCTSCTYTAAGLPSGLTISSAGLISGTPTKAGSSTVTVTATDSGGLTGSVSFTWKVVAGPAVSVTVSPTSATLGLGGVQVFTASAKDQYGNAASTTRVTWSTTAPGTLSPATGPKTTFTASSTTTGSGTVTATINGHTASATVTVD